MKTCQFCQKDTVYVPLKVSPKHTFQVYWCNDCNAEYLSNEDVHSIHLYTMVGSRMYRWSINRNDLQIEEPYSGSVWFIGEPGEPGIRPNRKLKLLKTFKDPIPQITPQNIERKLRFILVFL